MRGGRLRSRLHEATREAHERMHLHAGFGAAAAGQLDARAYRDLLARLFGFHKPFEAYFPKAPAGMAQAVALTNRRRSQALAEDLRALGLSRDAEALPQCAALPACGNEAQWLGALYVTEGSTLGGAFIAPALERAGFSRDQRRFFEAYGERRSSMWLSFLNRLERHADDEQAASQVEASARETFCVFEAWMRDWEGAAGAG